jgi:hypothetical protein
MCFDQNLLRQLTLFSGQALLPLRFYCLFSANLLFGGCGLLLAKLFNQIQSGLSHIGLTDRAIGQLSWGWLIYLLISLRLCPMVRASVLRHCCTQNLFTPA